MQYFALGACLLSVGVASVSRVTIASRGPEHTHKGWLQSEEPCGGSEPVHFTIFLKQNNLNKLLETFNTVSDPHSPLYGQFLSKQEVDEMVGADQASLSAVGHWLSSNSIQWTSTSDSLVVHTTCSKASNLFAVPFHHYQENGSGGSRLLCHGDATVPVDVFEHIDFVAGVSELWHGRHKRSKRSKSVSESDGDIQVTPEVLRAYYNVPTGERNDSPENSQAVGAFDDYFSQEALEKFYQNIDGGLGEVPVLDVVGVDCATGTKPCDQVESDLDVQYITAMGVNVKTTFFGANTTDGWVLGFTENAMQMENMPLVFSLSYGWPELDQCTVAVMTCFKLGYTSQQYLDRANVNFQKMAVRGTSILISDGDDGAQGTIPEGWDPIDTANWCPGEYTCYPKPEVPNKCANIVLHNTTTDDMCVYPVGHMNNGCSFLFLNDFYQTQDINKALTDANPNCDMQFFIDGDYNTHMYSACACEDMASLNHDQIRSEPLPTELDKNKRLFWPDFPTSSPFVTSVGATSFHSSAGTIPDTELGASVKDIAIITTGGGFSDFHDMPEYQEAALQAYMESNISKPPSGTYNSAGRGFPDITLCGHNYQVYYSTEDDSITCPCKQGGVDGTSASAPASAGLISLINGALLAAGKSQLGFLNPLLYAAYKDDPTIFNDIKVGDNKCTRDECMTFGFEAGEGWDPIGGLGSINYAKLKEYALRAQGVETVIV